MTSQLKVMVQGGPVEAMLADISGPLDAPGWTGVLEPAGDDPRRPPAEHMVVRVLDGDRTGQAATIHLDQTLSGGWPVTGITGFADPAR